MTIVELSPFEGRDVAQTTLKLTKAGDGLSNAMAIAPQEFHVGDRVTLVIDAVCQKVTHESIVVKGEELDGLARVHVLVAEAALPVERTVVQKVLDQHRKALDEAKGQGTLELDEN